MKLSKIINFVVATLIFFAYLLITTKVVNAANNCTGSVVCCATWDSNCLVTGAGTYPGDCTADTNQSACPTSYDCPGGNFFGGESAQDCHWVGGGSTADCNNSSGGTCPGQNIGDSCAGGDGTCVDPNNDGVCNCDTNGGSTGGGFNASGALDGFTCSSTSFYPAGWGGDKDDPNHQPLIEYYIDGTSSADKLGSIAGNLQKWISATSATAICNALGASNCSSDCATEATAPNKCKHRTNTVAVGNLSSSVVNIARDGLSHNAYAKIINKSGTPGSDTFVGPKAFTCPAPATRTCSVSLDTSTITTTGTATVTLSGNGNGISGTESVNLILEKWNTGSAIANYSSVISVPGGSLGVAQSSFNGKYYYTLNDFSGTSAGAANWTKSMGLQISSPGTYFLNCNVTGGGLNNQCSGNPFCSYENITNPSAPASPEDCSAYGFNSCSNSDNTPLVVTPSYSVSGQVRLGTPTIFPPSFCSGGSYLALGNAGTVYLRNSNTGVLVGQGTVLPTGNYTITGIPNGTYDAYLLLSSSSYACNCPSGPSGCSYEAGVVVNGANVPGVNFYANDNVYTVSGTVYNYNGVCTGLGGSGFPGNGSTDSVELTQSGVVKGSGSINASGNYTTTAVAPGTYVASLSLATPGWFSSCYDPQSVNITTANRTGINFGVTQIQPAWWQVVGGDAHTNSGGISSQIPQSTFHFDLLSGGIAKTSGIASHNGGTANWGFATDYREDNTQYIANSSYDTTGAENYEYFYSLFEMPTNIVGDDSAAFGTNGKSNAQKPAPATLPNSPMPGAGGKYAYYLDGSTTINNNTWNVAAGEWIVVFVKGNLIISGSSNPINVNPGGFLAFIVNGNIRVNNLGSSNGSYSGDGHMEGVYIANGTFDTTGGTRLERKLIVEGTVAAWGGITLGRNVSLAGPSGSPPADTDNNNYPSELFRYRPDFLLNAPDHFKKPTYTWSEVAP